MLIFVHKSEFSYYSFIFRHTLTISPKRVALGVRLTNYAIQRLEVEVVKVYILKYVTNKLKCGTFCLSVIVNYQLFN